MRKIFVILFLIVIHFNLTASPLTGFSVTFTNSPDAEENRMESMLTPAAKAMSKASGGG